MIFTSIHVMIIHSHTKGFILIGVLIIIKNRNDFAMYQKKLNHIDLLDTQNHHADYQTAAREASNNGDKINHDRLILID